MDGVAITPGSRPDSRHIEASAGSTTSNGTPTGSQRVHDRLAAWSCGQGSAAAALERRCLRAGPEPVTLVPSGALTGPPASPASTKALSSSSPVTTVSQDAELSVPSLPSEEFEAITGAYKVPTLSRAGAALPQLDRHREEDLSPGQLAGHAWHCRRASCLRAHPWRHSMSCTWLRRRALATPLSRACLQGAPQPDNEPEREAALCRLEVLDTSEDKRFDDITQLVPPRVVRAQATGNCG